MKKQTKGIIFTVIFGGGLLFWATAASMPNLFPSDDDEDMVVEDVGSELSEESYDYDDNNVGK